MSPEFSGRSSARISQLAGFARVFAIPLALNESDRSHGTIYAKLTAVPTKQDPCFLEVNYGGDLNLQQLAHGAGILDATCQAHLRRAASDSPSQSRTHSAQKAAHSQMRPSNRGHERKSA